MRYFGLKPDGGEIALPAPVEAELDSADDVPADGFRGVFPLAENCGMLTGLRIESGDGGTVFLGTVDIQRQIISAKGMKLSLSCRSLAGLLLDSEPIPQTYDYPNLATIFVRHIQPYGFTSFQGSTRIFHGPLRITKGMSEWRTAALFCKTYFQTVPRVHGSVFDATGESSGNPLILDNRHGVHYFRAEVRNRYCDRISQLYAPSPGTGTYGIAAEDKGTEALEIVRRRCLSSADTDGAALLRAADRKAFAVLADCPGLPETSVGADAELHDPVAGNFLGLAVAEISCRLGSGGIRTSYLLRRK